METIELLRITNEYTLLRLYAFGTKVSIMLNDLETNEAVAFDLTDLQLIELGKALIKAFENRGIYTY